MDTILHIAASGSLATICGRCLLDTGPLHIWSMVPHGIDHCICCVPDEELS